MSIFVIPLYPRFTKSTAHVGPKASSMDPLSPVGAEPLASALWKLKVHLNILTIENHVFFF